MAKPNFFCGIEALQALLGMELDGFEPEVELTVDLIEAPYLFIYTAEDDAWTLKVYGRGEIYNHEEGSGIEKGSLRVDRKTRPFNKRYDKSMSSPYMKKSSSNRPISSSAFFRRKQKAPLITSILPGLSHDR